MDHFTWVDYTILGIFGFSMLAGLLRGFLKEVIALCTWIAATVLSCLFASKLAVMFSGSAQSVSLLSIGVSFAAIFISTLIGGSIINFIINRMVEWGGISMANRFLGALFGMVRAFIIVVVLTFLIQLTPIGLQPAWAASPMVLAFQPCVQWFGGIVQPGLDSLKTSVSNAAQKANDQVKQQVTGVVNQYQQGTGQ